MNNSEPQPVLRQTQVKECRSWICRMQKVKEEAYQIGPRILKRVPLAL